MEFICNNCRYRFKSENDYKKKTCPYCGKNQVVEEPDAQCLIDGVD